MWSKAASIYTPSTDHHLMPVIHCAAYTEIHPNYARRVLYFPVVVHCRAKRSVRGSISNQSIHIKTIRYLRVVDSRGPPYTVLYARCTQGGFWFLFPFTRGWILVDPVQWITGMIRTTTYRLTTNLSSPRLIAQLVLDFPLRSRNIRALDGHLVVWKLPVWT